MPVAGGAERAACFLWSALSGLTDRFVPALRSLNTDTGESMTTNGKVFSINVGAVREFEYKGRPAKSAIWKTPVVGRIAARGVNLEGDDQADREAHGGPDKALYAYAVEDL